ncbi:MAG TPA: asparagine synthase (glutamine-hydrolyzing) [Pyrinomonadaceae bacterium]|nr:asparagine synthase (glutamine-hydrolyzing) [Pyrinomonadaceae bacterium]
MCGIAGLAGFDDRRGAEARVRAMVGALARRGPDAEGMHAWDGATLGHRRLSIFDLSDSGRQPMLSPDNSTGVVFNGAIYNFPALRAELVARGFEFRSRTDTEVLIHGYREWGIDGLVARLHGMFAFGLWDARARRLFLVRDRLGVKPLVYAARDGRIAFASTVRALRRGGFTGELDEQAVMEYLEFGFVTDERAIYEGVGKVPAATIVEWSDGKLTSREYWTPPDAATDESAPSFDEAVEETERLFLRAVEMRLQADVPVGALLSGGVDSSLVCWAIARLGGDVTAYTISTPGDPWDESADARATAAALGISHRVLELSADDSPDVAELATAYAEPFACASALGMLRVSRAVAPEATVLLTGDGGDDVFLGYPEHRHFLFAQRIARRLPRAAARAWWAAEASFPRRGILRRMASFLTYTTGGLGALASVHDGLPVYRKHELLGARLAERNISQRERAWSLDSARDLLAEFLAYDRKLRFTGEYLPKVDGATMHYALEARSPFLDQELWSFAASLPFSLRLRNNELKAVLRELARRKLGERVAGGRKRGFGVPVQRWLAGRWRARLEEVLRDSALERQGWLRPANALRLLEHTAGEGHVPNQLWYIFVLESWLRHERAESTAMEATFDAGDDSLRAFAPLSELSA